MTDRELFKMALDVLNVSVDGGKSEWSKKVNETKEALRARLAEDEITPDGYYKVAAWIKEKP